MESLVPAGLEKGTIDDFLNGLPKYDGEMKKRFDEAAARGKVLRYVGRLTADGKATVGVWSSTGRMPSRTSRSPTTWCAMPRRVTTTIR